MRFLTASIALLICTALAPAAYDWRIPPNGDNEIALVQDGVQVGSYSYNGDYFRYYDRATDSWGKKTTPPVAPPKHQEVKDRAPATGALQEVNAVRARSGLPPYVEDPSLTAAAQRAATYRANLLIEGHTANDFAFLAGSWASAAGCAAWPPHMGWGSCCTYDAGPRYAGAGWAAGRDGRRYMHLFIR